MEQKKLLTDNDLFVYRGLVGLQLKYASEMDSHKVIEMQHAIMALISDVCKRVLKEKTGEDFECEWSQDAKDQYAKMCGDALTEAGKGFEAWIVKQAKIEAWVERYIEQAIVQAQLIDVRFKTN